MSLIFKPIMNEMLDSWVLIDYNDFRQQRPKFGCVINETTSFLIIKDSIFSPSNTSYQLNVDRYASSLFTISSLSTKYASYPWCLGCSSSRYPKFLRITSNFSCSVKGLNNSYNSCVLCFYSFFCC
jgi:hypothetical protein